MLTHYQVWGVVTVLRAGILEVYLAGEVGYRVRCGCGWQSPEGNGWAAMDAAMTVGYEHEKLPAFEFGAFEMGALERGGLCKMSLRLCDLPGLYAAVISAVNAWPDDRRQRFAITCEQALIAEVWRGLNRAEDVQRALSFLVRDTLLPSRDVPGAG